MSEKSLLGKWLSKKKDQSNEDKTEAAYTAVQSSYPLAWNQLGLYFLCQQNLENPFYNYLDLYFIKGELDVTKFIQAFHYLVERHDAFRIRFIEEQGKVSQVVMPPNQDHLEVLYHEEGDSE
ncbi:MAG: condensation domain-containing protein, partial [Bacteroidota bacterium]